MAEIRAPAFTPTHSHMFLGEDHEKAERRTWAVIWLCGIMMAAEILGGALFGSLALIADGLHMSTHAGALLLAALAYTYARTHANDASYAFGTGKFGDLAGYSSAIILAMMFGGLPMPVVIGLAIGTFLALGIICGVIAPLILLGIFVSSKIMSFETGSGAYKKVLTIMGWPSIISIVSAASQTTSPPQSTTIRSPDPPPKPETRILTRTANAAAFTPAAMKPVTGAGAPSYTSGTHMWKGTAATLKANPAVRRAAAP